MPIYDFDGTVNREIGKLYDNNGSVNTQIGNVYDNNGSANSLIYNATERYTYWNYGAGSYTGVKQGTSNFTNAASVTVHNTGALWVGGIAPLQLLFSTPIDVTQYKTMYFSFFATTGQNSSSNIILQIGMRAPNANVWTVSTNKILPFPSNWAWSVFEGSLNISNLYGNYWPMAELVQTPNVAMDLLLQYLYLET